MSLGFHDGLELGDHGGHANEDLEELGVRGGVAHDGGVVVHVLDAVAEGRGGGIVAAVGIGGIAAAASANLFAQAIVEEAADLGQILLGSVDLIPVGQAEVAVGGVAVDVGGDGVAGVGHAEDADDGHLAGPGADHLALGRVGIGREGLAADHVDVEPLHVEGGLGGVQGGLRDGGARPAPPLGVSQPQLGRVGVGVVLGEGDGLLLDLVGDVHLLGHVHEVVVEHLLRHLGNQSSGGGGYVTSAGLGQICVRYQAAIDQLTNYARAICDMRYVLHRHLKLASALGVQICSIAAAGGGLREAPEAPSCNLARRSGNRVKRPAGSPRENIWLALLRWDDDDGSDVSV